MRVGLLACDEVAERFRHIAGGYQQMFEQLLLPHIPGLRLTRFDVQAGDIPGGARKCDALDHDRIACVRVGRRRVDPRGGSVVRHVADSDCPLVGICFGHELLARTLGAKVERAPEGWA